MSMNDALADNAPTDHEDQALVMRARPGDRQVLEDLIERIKHARYYWLLLAESHLTSRPFAAMLRKITMLLSPAQLLRRRLRLLLCLLPLA